MANLENKNENKDKKSVSEQIESKISHSLDQVKDQMKNASEFASDAIHHPIETAQEIGKQAKKDMSSYSWWAKLLLILFWFFITIFVVLLIVINLPVTKKWAADQALQLVNKDFKAQMSTDDVEVNFFGDVSIKGLKIKDYKGYEFIKVKTFTANSDWFSLATNIGKHNSLSFNSLKLEEADVKVITYKGDSISNFIRFIDLFDDGKPKDPKKPPFLLNSRIELANSKVSIVNQNSPGEEGKWLEADQVNLRVPKLKVKGAEIDALINNFSFRTKRRGKYHTIDTFSAAFSLNNQYLSLKDLTFHTDHSLLQGDIKFILNQGKWEDFTHKVKWDLAMKKGGYLSGYDIGYFVPQWDNFSPVDVSGKMNGTLNKMALRNFHIGNKDVHIATEQIELNQLLDGNFLINSPKIAADFTYVNLKKMLPTFISQKMKNYADEFGKLKYNGSINLTPNELNIANGQLFTGIGQAKINNFKLKDFSTNQPKYSGNAQLTDFNVAAITKNKTVGLVSGTLFVDGQGFDVNTMKLRTKSLVSSIEVMDKKVRNLHLDGILDRRTYNGLISVNDPQANATIKGLIDFSTPKIAANIIADINSLNVNYFTNTPGSQIISGNIEGKVAMTNINDLFVDANANNIRFAMAGKSYAIPQLKLNTYVDSKGRVIKVNAPSAIEGTISGNYNLTDLQGMIENGLGKILVGPEPRKKYAGQNFQLDFAIQQNAINYFLPELKIPSGLSVVGGYNGNSNHLNLNIDAESLLYIIKTKKDKEMMDAVLAKADIKPEDINEITSDSAKVQQLSLRINTADPENQIFTKIDRVEYKKNILKDIEITAKNENNSVLNVYTHFKHGNPEDEKTESLKNYAINFSQSSNAEGDYIIRFQPTEISFNNVAWAIDTNPALDHYLRFIKKTKELEIKNLKIFSDKSSVFINQALLQSADDFYIDAQVQNFSIAKILEMQEGGNTMDIQGIANGDVKIKMDKKSLQPIIEMTVDDITMNGNDMGDISLSATNGFSLNVFDIDARVTSSGILGGNNLHLTGTVNNNGIQPEIDLIAKLNDFDLAFTQQFVKTVFGNFRGKASGDLKINGTLDDINYSGDIALKDFGLKLLFTGVDYRFDDTVIPLSRGLAILNDIGVKDSRSNSKGSISGAIQFETLSQMGVNLVMRAENLLMLDTTQKDFDLFWGRVYGKGELYIDGPVSGLSLTTPNMKTMNGSTFTFNSASTSNVDQFKMLQFLTEDASGAVSINEKKANGANMNINFSLDVDKGTTVNVLVGDDAGSISVKGMANNLRFQMSRQGNISMNGEYLVDSGTFLSQAFLNRTFQIQKNSSIRWDGNAMKPNLAIRANYIRQVSNAGEYLNMGQLQPINVMVQTIITNTLNDPDIKIEVSALDVSSQVKETLASKINQTDGENVLQAGSIILLNSFNVANTGLKIDAAGLAESSGYNLILKQLGSVFNTISNQFQIDLNFVKGDQNANLGDRAVTGVNIEFSPRLKIKTGLGIPLSNTEVSKNNYLTGEGSIEYDLSKNNDGTFLLRGYSKPSNIGMGITSTNGSANQSYGGGVVWSKSFNSFFPKKKKKTDEKNEEKNKTDSVKIQQKK